MADFWGLIVAIIHYLGSLVLLSFLYPGWTSLVFVLTIFLLYVRGSLKRDAKRLAEINSKVREVPPLYYRLADMEDHRAADVTPLRVMKLKRCGFQNCPKAYADYIAWKAHMKGEHGLTEAELA